MKCKYHKCDGDSMVFDSRHDLDTGTIWRRRKCKECKRTWTTAEDITRKPWMDKNPCSEKDCIYFTRFGHRICDFHIAAHRNAKHRQIRADLKNKTLRRCKNHPDVQANTKMTVLLCNPCLVEYMKNRRRSGPR